eukprot:TRINITY_DN91382_c0_g1_i1.p1 TRINITY_DN91382_c0_g1~~TRINITY_DN91382_c0_g1_i1.p1  ORF type:complete len:886 (-),score=161.60 TRINITY_DN91382_c0_g1_i1:104-2761(-)
MRDRPDASQDYELLQPTRLPARWTALLAPLWAALLLSSCVVPAVALSALSEPLSHRIANLIQQHELHPIGGMLGNLQEKQLSSKETDMDDWQPVELLRFVTPYGSELDTIVDITPYSQLLEASLNSVGSMAFYVQIDTWVNNHTEFSVMYVNNETGACTSINTSSGNGWNVSVDLIIWEQGTGSEANVPTIRPRATVVLAAGYPATIPSLGAVSVYEGSLLSDGSQEQVNLLDEADLSGSDLESYVYACPSGKQALQRDAFMGFVSRAAEHFAQEEAKQSSYMGENSSSNRSVEVKKKLYDLELEILQHLVDEDMIQGSIHKVKEVKGQQLLEVALSKPAKLQAGMPVYFAANRALTDQLMSTGRWFNMSLPFEPFGNITHVLNASSFVMDVASQICFMDKVALQLPHVQVPKDPHVVPNATKTMRAAIQRGVGLGILKNEVASNKDDEDVADSFLLLSNAASKKGAVKLLEEKPVGRIVKDSGSDASFSGDLGSASKEVCVVKKKQQGQVLTRRFTASLNEGERALLQLAVTGHGWSATTEHCGEYCHVVYQLKLNGEIFANVTQWRDDCHKNPQGYMQRGTWDESRNGWCPGSVEPGVFIDVTDSLDKSSRADSNFLELSVTVWSNATHRYMPYTDYGGFALGDQAMLAIAMNLMIYDSNAVAAAHSMDQSLTKAQAALRQGCSDPFALRPPAVLSDRREQSLLAKSATHAHPSNHSHGSPNEDDDDEKHTKAAEVADDGTTNVIGQTGLRHRRASVQRGFYDFEGRAPWYFYNQSRDGIPGLNATFEGTLVPVFENRLVQSASRKINTNIGLEVVKKLLPASTWREIGLRLRLGKPANLETDHWDRLGGFGILLPGNLQGVEVKNQAAPPTHKSWKLAKDFI